MNNRPKTCKDCECPFDTLYLFEIDRIYVGHYCRYCAGVKSDALKQRFGWYPEVHKRSRHDLYQLKEKNIKDLSENILPIKTEFVNL